MVKYFTFFILLFLLSSNTFSSKHLIGAEALGVIPGATEVWYKSDATLPSYIRFEDDFVLNETDVMFWLKAQFNFQSELSLRHIGTVDGSSGLSHSSYALEYQDIKMEFLRLNVHSKAGLVRSISGIIINKVVLTNSIGLSENEALNFALNEVNAVKYKWDDKKEEQWLKEQLNDMDASYRPKSSIVILSEDGNLKTPNFKYAHKFDVYASNPNLKLSVYVDAESGEILHKQNLLHSVDSIGVGNTAYSGKKEIITEYTNGKFILRDRSRVSGIITRNMHNTTNFASAIDFTNDVNEWFYVPAGNLDQYASDAHWAAEMTLDYFSSNLQRNSYDGLGHRLDLYVHYGEGVDKAFWDGDKIVVGDGANNLPHTTIDIIAHEFTHGLIEHSAALIYSDESGALNESFCDIFGNCVEIFGKPNDASWRIGDDRGSFSRDMEDPNGKSHPDTYKGNFWYTGPSDFGGVHTNSGVQNYWFYLVSEGGTGKNDNDDLYTIQGIGTNDAALIAYESLTGYLTPTSDYEEAQFYSVKVAIEKFGRCSPQHTAVANAWYAVGIGEEFTDHAVASFNETPMSFCTAPFTVNFYNNSINADVYFWSFDDGSTSTELNPSHTFNSLDNYSIELAIVGVDHCGNDAVKYENLYTDGRPAMPNSITPPGDHVKVNYGERVELRASTGSENGEVHWYKNKNDAFDDYIAVGGTYIVPSATKPDTFFIRTIYSGNTHEVGEDLNAVLNNGEYSNAAYAMRFDMLQSATIESVSVRAGSAGSRTLIIKDANGNQVYSKAFDLVKGINEVLLNVSVSKAENYEMMVSDVNKDLWRSHDAKFPYEISGLISLTGNNLNSEVLYPYFFNWKLKENDCVSSTSEITVGIDKDQVPNQQYKFYTESGSNGGYDYYLELYFLSETTVNYALYSISGQKLMDYTPPAYEEKTIHRVNLTQELNLDDAAGGVYFITIKGGDLEKSERVILKSGSN